MQKSVHHTQQTQSDDLERRFRTASQQIGRLCRSPNAQTPEGLDDIQAALEQLPLTSSEFQLAINRITNARKYQITREVGATLYELRLLLGLVNKCQAAFVGLPEFKQL